MRTISFSSLVKLKILKEVLFKDLSLALCIVFKYIYFQIISMITARQVDRPMVMLGVVEGEEKDTDQLDRRGPCLQDGQFWMVVEG